MEVNTIWSIINITISWGQISSFNFLGQTVWIFITAKRWNFPRDKKVKATTKNLPNQSLTQFSVLNITSYVLTFAFVANISKNCNFPRAKNCFLKNGTSRYMVHEKKFICRPWCLLPREREQEKEIQKGLFQRLVPPARSKAIFHRPFLSQNWSLLCGLPFLRGQENLITSGGNYP